MKVKSEIEVAQSCLTLNDPMDFSPPGSSVHGIFQARVLEWGAIAFFTLLLSSYESFHWSPVWCVCVCMLLLLSHFSHVQLCATP